MLKLIITKKKFCNKCKKNIKNYFCECKGSTSYGLRILLAINEYPNETSSEISRLSFSNYKSVKKVINEMLEKKLLKITNLSPYTRYQLTKKGKSLMNNSLIRNSLIDIKDAFH